MTVLSKRGYDLTSDYMPTDAEFDFVDAVYEAEKAGAIPQEVADQVRIIQFRKVRNSKLFAPDDAKRFLRDLASRCGVEPQF